MVGLPNPNVATPVVTGGGSSSFSISDMYNNMSGRVEANTNSFTDLTSKLKMDNFADMGKYQMELQKWTMSVSMQSTMMKEMGETMKGVIQKMT